MCAYIARSLQSLEIFHLDIFSISTPEIYILRWRSGAHARQSSRDGTV